ncbi:MAG: TetR/AcrR family transcriptional regulator [Solirubrobacterales bacterium]
MHKRRRMMDAMAELTAERGYGATKIADVVARAGVARKTLYDNFSGKEDLFLAAFETTLDEARGSVEAACATATIADGAAVEAGLEALLDFLAEHPAQARMCLVEALSATPATAVRYEAAIQGFIALLRQGSPPAPGRPGTLEETLVGGVVWILQQWIRNEETEMVGQLLPELSAFVLSPYPGVGKPDG